MIDFFFFFQFQVITEHQMVISIGRLDLQDMGTIKVWNFLKKWIFRKIVIFR